MKSDSEDKYEDSSALVNPLFAEVEADANKKDCKRRVWSNEEEEALFKIWGRENYRLTKSGGGKMKNTMYFAQWAEELKEVYGFVTTAVEVQAKVNTTRSKFRQEKKKIETDGSETRWKKFDIIEKIIRNQYRPEDAEPLPPEVLNNKKGFFPDQSDDNDESAKQSQPAPAVTPSSITSSSQDSGQQQQHTQNLLHNEGHAQLDHQPNINHSNMNVSEHDVTGGLYEPTSLYSLDMSQEVKTSLSNEMKQDDFSSSYQHHSSLQQQQPIYATSQQYENPNQYVSTVPPSSHQNEAPHLMELQTAHHQQRGQEPMPAHHQQYPPYNQQMPTNNIPPPAVQNGMMPLNQHHVPQSAHLATNYEQHQTDLNSYATTGGSVNYMPTNQNHYTQVQQLPLPPPPMQHTEMTTTANTTAPAYPPYLGHIKVEEDASNTPAVTQPLPQAQPHLQPVSSAPPQSTTTTLATPQTTTIAPAPRKRVRNYSHAHSAINANASNANSLESQFLEQIRKKNSILEEHKEIAKKRLRVEERKVSLMEEFFPKCLELHMKILEKSVSSRSGATSNASQVTPSKAASDTTEETLQLTPNGVKEEDRTLEDRTSEDIVSTNHKSEAMGGGEIGKEDGSKSKKKPEESSTSKNSRKESVIQKLLESIADKNESETETFNKTANSSDQISNEMFLEAA